MTSRYRNFTIVAHKDTAEFCAEVNRLLDLGWELYGDWKMVETLGRTPMKYQALVQVDRPPSKIGD